jgi:pimeloyl-ACP methyl ester carboxylesterase
MQIHSLEFGEKGKPLVFLHGWQQTSRSFLPLVNFLCNDYRLFFLDLPGFGKSQPPSPNYSSFDYAKEVQNWIKKKKLKNVVLIGHSFGGKIGIIIASQNSPFLEKLILIASAGIPHPSKYAPLVKLIPNKLKQIIPLKFKSLSASRDYKEAGVLLSIFKRVVTENVQPLLKDIAIPTLIIWGKNDSELLSEDGKIMKNHIKKSKLVVIEGGHFPFWENPQKVSELIKKFV